MKHKPKDMSDPRVLRAETARMSEDLNRIMRGREFESKEELEKFTQDLTGKSFDDIEMPEMTTQDKAQYLIYDAWEEKSAKRRTEMARKALELWPDCADAYCVLAEEADSEAEERSMLETAVAAGERAIGLDPFKEDVGRFWGIHATRPYMRSRFMLASFLWNEEENEAAIKNARELLRLNPNDNQGVRYSLVGWLLAVGNNRGAVVLLDKYDEDSACWEYARALLEFRTWGDSDRARTTLERAFQSNETFAPYLLAIGFRAHRLPEDSDTDEDVEAILAVADLLEPWKTTPGALGWLRDRWLSQISGRDKR
jgi:tetratricopeptide (TPR) repeat protein